MTKREPPSPELLHQLLRYEPETGRLFWRERPDEMFATLNAARSWNAKHAGKEAFTATDSDGYRKGSIFDTMYRAHRVIWAMETGEWPEDQIDHENGIRGDNRFINLRDATNAENARNQRMPASNTSGAIGVSRHSQTRKWRAMITVGGTQRCLGHFSDFDAAVSARRAAEIEHGFHANHGRSQS